MKRSKLKALLRLLVLLAITAAWDLRAAVPPGYPPPDEGRASAKSKPDLEAQVFAKYRKWTRVNSAPVKLAGVIAAACAPTPLPGPPASQGAEPHADKLINVFVNKIGRTAMLAEKKPQFPEGAIIVKERLPLKKSSAAEWLMAMVKREEGQALVEYTLILALVSVVAIAALTSIGTEIVAQLGNVVTAL